MKRGNLTGLGQGGGGQWGVGDGGVEAAAAARNVRMVVIHFRGWSVLGQKNPLLSPEGPHGEKEEELQQQQEEGPVEALVLSSAALLLQGYLSFEVFSESDRGGAAAGKEGRKEGGQRCHSKKGCKGLWHWHWHRDRLSPRRIRSLP